MPRIEIQHKFLLLAQRPGLPLSPLPYPLSPKQNVSLRWIRSGIYCLFWHPLRIGCHWPISNLHHFEQAYSSGWFRAIVRMTLHNFRVNFYWQAEQSRHSQWSSSWTHFVWQKSDSELFTCWPLADASNQGSNFRVHVENRLTDITMERTTGIVSSSTIESIYVGLCRLAALARSISKGCEKPTVYKLQWWCNNGNAMPYCSWEWLRVRLCRPTTGM